LIESQPATSPGFDLCIVLENLRTTARRGRSKAIGAKQTMIMVFCTARKLVILDVLPKGSKFNSLLEFVRAFWGARQTISMSTINCI
jgi:hypothetical protein